jgi:hypothetical protein
MAALFEPVSEDMILKALRQSKQANRDLLKLDFERAIDYLNNNQFVHVEEALLERYENTQLGDKGQEIVPVTMPLTERYIAEAASAYNKPVERSVIGIESNAEDEELTKKLTDYLKRIGYDEKMHRNEQLSLLLSTSCIWYQEKRGILRPVIVYPQDVYPIINPDDPSADPSDPEDYLGFVIEVLWTADDTISTTKRTFVAVLPEKTLFYEAHDPYSPVDKIVMEEANPFTWPQANNDGNTVERPLQMLTFWHKQQYEQELIIKADPDIANANHELNVQWSLLFDTMRMQGWSTPVMSLINQDKAPPKLKHGSRFPIVIDPGETYDLKTGAAPYTEVVEALKTYTKLLAIAKRQSPNDFSIDQSNATSGFAKIVDSLPKIEARNERLRRLKRLEEQVAWPRIASILRKQKVFPASIATTHKLSVKFSDVEVLKSPDERRTEIETDTKYHLSNPVDIIMDRMDVSREEAEEIYQHNKEVNKGGKVGEEEQQLQPGIIPPNQEPATQALARLVAQRKGKQIEEGEPDAEPPT